MYSRCITRRLTTTLPSLLVNRSFTSTPIRFAAAAKLKEKTASDAPPAAPSPATPVESTKVYSEKIQRLVDEISKLSLVDVMDLNDLLKKTLKIQDVPIVATGGGGAAAGSASPAAAPKKEEEEEENRPTAQSVFKVRLIKFDETKKVPVIKQVKDVVENINLVQAKKLVESIPQVLRDNLSKTDAETMKAKIEAAGGVCVIE